MPKKRGRPESKNPKDEMVHFAYTREEKEKLENFAKNKNVSISEFIRLAIEEKIRRIENPELATTGINNTKILRELLKNQKLLDEKNSLIVERLDTYNQIINTLELLKPRVNNIYLKEKMEKMKTVLKAYNGELKPKKLEELTGFDGNTIKEILAYYNDIFTITINGGIKLNE